MEARINFNPLLLLLEIFSKPLCSFRTWTILTLPPHCRIKGLLNGKVLLRSGRKNTQVILSLSLSLVFVFALLVCFAFVFWVNLVLCYVLIDMFLFVSFQFCFFFSYKKNWKIRKIQKQCIFVYISTCIPWMAIETKFSKLYIFCSLDEHIYAQLSKWVLWLVFVMSKVKWSLVLNTYITLFDRND